MSTQEVYQREKQFLSKKVPSLPVHWEAREAIEQLISPTLGKTEASRIYTKYMDALKARAGLRINLLIKLLETDKKLQHFRVAISIKLLRAIFAQELEDFDGSGGGLGVRQKQQPTPSTGFSRKR